MIFYIISLFPGVIEEYCKTSVIGRGIARGGIKVEHIQLRDYAEGKHGKVDNKPYGGGNGMLLRCDCLDKAIGSRYESGMKLIFLSPIGEVLTQRKVRELEKEKRMILVCGYYEGVDERIYKLYKDHEKVSIGDYILSNGSLGALVIIDSVLRLKVIRNKESVIEESFNEESFNEGSLKEGSLKEGSFSGGLLEYSQYTKPRSYKGLEVPEVLLRGNHKEILRYRRRSSLKKTMEYRGSLLLKKKLSLEELEMMTKILEEEGGFRKW